MAETPAPSPSPDGGTPATTPSRRKGVLVAAGVAALVVTAGAVTLIGGDAGVPATLPPPTLAPASGSPSPTASSGDGLSDPNEPVFEQSEMADPSLEAEFGVDAALGRWPARRPDGVPALVWWESTVQTLWYPGDGFIPDPELMVKAWSDPAQSDLPADDANTIALTALRVAEIDYTKDVDGRYDYPSYWPNPEPQPGRPQLPWEGFRTVAAASARPLNGPDGYAYALVLWEADRDPNQGGPVDGVRATPYVFENRGGTWVPVLCFEASAAGLEGACTPGVGNP